jgi:hypothetical protein
MRIKLYNFEDNYSIASIDYSLGDGVNVSNIFKMLKEQTSDNESVLLSHSRNVKKKVSPGIYDFLV